MSLICRKRLPGVDVLEADFLIGAAGDEEPIVARKDERLNRAGVIGVAAEPAAGARIHQMNSRPIIDGQKPAIRRKGAGGFPGGEAGTGVIEDTNLVSSACVMDFGAPVPVDMETIALRRDDHVPGRLALDQNRGLRVRLA